MTTTTRKVLIISILLLLGFAILAFSAASAPYFGFDLAISKAVQSYKLPVLSQYLYVLNWIGYNPQSYIISAVIILFILLRGFTLEGILSLVSVLASTFLGRYFKALIARPRPDASLVQVEEILHDLSFPSGHVLYFTVFFGFLLFLTITLLHPSWKKTFLILLLASMVALIGLARVYTGNHWTSDVLGGYLLGGGLLGLTIVAYQIAANHSQTAQRTPKH
ncbi:MAG TPA: phosphatase PAP2 family protein [Bellilinea sp.]|nr:phosphatase PAP2 family protein [Bellilinea sp.]